MHPFKASLLALFLLFPFHASAGNQSHAVAWDSSFWSGFAGGIITHELGHISMAASYGQSSQFHAGSVIYPNSNFTSKEALRVSTAGFQTQWLFSEWAFSELAFYEPNNPEATLLNKQQYIGLITSHIAISAAYLVLLKDEPTSDIYNAAATSGRSRNELMWAALAPAILDAYRLWGDAPRWVDYLSMSIKAGEIGLIWTFE